MSSADATADQARRELYGRMQRDASFEDKATAALELAESYLGVDNAHLTRIQPEFDYWKNITSTDPPDGDFPEGQVLDLNTTYCRRVVERDDTIALHNAPEQGWADDPAFEEHRLHCYHGTPIHVDGDIFGTLCFVADSPREGPFTDEDTLFADLVARLIEHELEYRSHEDELARQSTSVAVLSRVLRHNLRNEMTVVRGRISMLTDHLDHSEAPDSSLFESIDRVIDLSDKARKLESVISATDDREPVAFDALLERAITDATTSYPDADIRVEGQSDVTIEAMTSLEVAFEELLENAAKHGGDTPEVIVSVTPTEDTVELRISDDGPGLDDQERDVLAEGDESPLVHGSGLGLWMVYWIVTSHDGSIDAIADEDGTTVTIVLPRVGNPDEETPMDDVRTLQRGFDRFQAVFEESFDAMVIVNDERRIIDVNERAAELFECSADELLGRRVAEFAGPRFDVDAVWETIQQGGKAEGRFPLVSATGTERTIEYSVSANIIPGQHLLIGRDITERLEQERELKETTDQLEAILGTIEVAVFIKDTEGRYQLMNHKCRELLGVGPQESVEGRLDEEFFPPEVAEQIRAQDQRVMESSETLEIEEEIPIDGEHRTFLTVKSPLYGDDGTLAGLCGVASDTTDRKD